MSSDSKSKPPDWCDGCPAVICTPPHHKPASERGIITRVNLGDDRWTTGPKWDRMRAIGALARAQAELADSWKEDPPAGACAQLRRALECAPDLDPNRWADEAIRWAAFDGGAIEEAWSRDGGADFFEATVFAGPPEAATRAEAETMLWQEIRADLQPRVDEYLDLWKPELKSKKDRSREIKEAEAIHPPDRWRWFVRRLCLREKYDDIAKDYGITGEAVRLKCKELSLSSGMSVPRKRK